MGDLVVFEYAVVRVVPDIERGEFVNAGVIVYCPDRDYLDAVAALDRERLRVLAADADADEIDAALAAFIGPCTGEPERGFTGERRLGGWFRWLTAPRSTVVQTGPAHAGLTDDPAAELARLADRLVR